MYNTQNVAPRPYRPHPDEGQPSQSVPLLLPETSRDIAHQFLMEVGSHGGTR
jgi:hypothetical protein